MIAAPIQRTLPLQISAAAMLLSPKTAGAVLGWHVDAVLEAAQSWPWVFDLGTGRRIVSELRIWKRHIQDTALETADLKPEDVFAEIIGTDSADVRGAFLETRWDVSGPTLHRLWKANRFQARVAGHTLWIDRASLVKFLAGRIVR